MLRRPTLSWISTACWVGSLWCAAITCGQTPSFELDVEPVLAKAGCNAGNCHGNQNGKGGFKLSLRGQDPSFDYEALVASNAGRRINLLEPEKSLLLRKPTMEIAHQGGKRLAKPTTHYQQLWDWIAAGAPPPTGDVSVQRLVVRPGEAILFAPTEEVRLQVEARYSDGSVRDVSHVAVYEPSNLNVEVDSAGLVARQMPGESTVVVRYLNQQVPVRVAFLDLKSEFRWNQRRPRNDVDRWVFRKLKKFRTNPAAICSDHVFLRRAFLDVLGLLPTSAEARRFAADKNPLKRDALIDTLLAPEFADYWALKWADLLRIEENILDRKGVRVFHHWIRESIASGKPLNQFVAKLLLARGSTYENPPTNYFRALRKTNDRGEAAARVFLGTRLQCAQCHNHPFDRWTQDDYYAWSAVFARIEFEIVENKRLDKLDKNQFVGEQRVRDTADGDVTHPTTGQVMAPRLLGEQTTVAGDADRLAALAHWLTAANNRQFAQAQVNRIWFHLMGRGLVDPVDDFRVTNPASHPELLERLADRFVARGFDIRSTIRTIMQSESYQLASTTEQDGKQYSVVAARRLTAEQLLDAQSQALAAVPQFNGHPPGIRAAQLPGVHTVRFREQAPSPADRFLFAFGKPERLMTCECERSDSTTLSQALLLVNGECIDALLTQDTNLIGQLLGGDTGAETAIQELYWAALSRPPSVEELHAAHAVMDRGESPRQGLEDVAWALLNAKEFVFRQ